MNDVETKTEHEQIYADKVQHYRELGYTVQVQEDGSEWVIPKNAATGEDDFEAMPLKLWEEPQIEIE